MYALLIADDPDMTAVFSTILQRAGLAVTTDRELSRAMKNWIDRPADLIVLSLNNLSPESQVQEVRTEAQVPLFICVNSLDPDLQRNLLHLGADFVIEPRFNPRLLITQIRSFLRRTTGLPVSSLPPLTAANFKLEPDTRTVTVTGKPSQRLTHLEFRLLYTLMTSRGHVIPTETIVERVWGYTGQGDRELVRGLISRLRTKVELNPQQPCHIITVPGIGYVFYETIEEMD